MPPPTPNATVPPNRPPGIAGPAEGESALDCLGSHPAKKNKRNQEAATRYAPTNPGRKISSSVDANSRGARVEPREDGVRASTNVRRAA
jgi:hypothetical protein